VSASRKRSGLEDYACYEIPNRPILKNLYLHASTHVETPSPVKNFKKSIIKSTRDFERHKVTNDEHSYESKIFGIELE
jgi:hypothetical protein